MPLSGREIKNLIRMIGLTRADELTCDDCLVRLAEFAEANLRGRSVPEGLRLVEHHLAVCDECEDEYQALLSALEDLPEGSR